jgi:hypothetical protein
MFCFPYMIYPKSKVFHGSMELRSEFSFDFSSGYRPNILFVCFESVLLQNIDIIPEPADISTGQDLYFEVLELQPIKLSLSFMRTERVSSEEKY